MRRALSLIAVCMISSVSCSSFSSQQTLREKVKAASAENAGLNSLSAQDFDALARHLEKGEADWIRLVPALAEHTDASYSEGLTISLARALVVNPAAVLSILDPRDSSLSVNRVCSVPFIEISDDEADEYVKAAVESVGKVTSPALQGRKRACLHVLELPPGAPIE